MSESHLLTRRAVLLSLLASGAMPAFAGAPKTSLRPVPRPKGGVARAIKARHEQPSLRSILDGAGLSGKMSVVVADATTGQILESRGADVGLPPASVTKTMTTLYALDHLGGDYRFNTRVIGTGPIRNGVLQGDLILVGGGDPQLDSDGLGDLAAQLRVRGLKRITGKFRVYSDALPYQRSIDPGQPEYVGYNPAVSGLNLNFNRVYFEWKRTGKGYNISMDARGEQFRPLVRGITMSIRDRQGPLFTYKSGKRENWSVSRSALGKAGGRWLPVRNCAAYAGEVFQSLAAAHGIRLPAAGVAKAVPTGAVLAQETSGPLSAVLRAMLKYSTNLTAEVSGLTATRQGGGNVGTLPASAREMVKWLSPRFGLNGLRFLDHSGMNDKNRLTGQQMVNVLVKTGWNGQLRPLLKHIKLVNSKGRKAPIKGVNVVAKTGTLNFTSALAGYIECPNGRKLAFAIFSADLGKRAKIPKAKRARPDGGRKWDKRAKRMQQKLLRRWALEYGVS